MNSKEDTLRQLNGFLSIGSQRSKVDSSAAYWLLGISKFLSFSVSIFASLNGIIIVSVAYFFLGLLWRFYGLIYLKPLELAQSASLFCQGFSSHLYHTFVLKIDFLDLYLISGTPLCEVGKLSQFFHLWNRDNNIKSIFFSWRLNVLIRLKCLEQCPVHSVQ